MIKVDSNTWIEYFAGSKNKDLKFDNAILQSLLIDVNSLNNILVNLGLGFNTFHIEYEDQHTEYSPERTDPCPDFYGEFFLVFDKTNETIGEEMFLSDLDNTIMILSDFIMNYKESKINITRL